MDNTEDLIETDLLIPQSTDLTPLDTGLPQTLFVVPIHTSPIYPGMMAPIIFTDPKVIETVEAAISNRGIIGVMLVKEENLTSKSTDLNRFFSFGTAVRILKKINISEGTMTVLVQSLKRFEVKKLVRQEPFTVVQVEYKEDIINKSTELDALTRSVISHVKSLSEHNPFFTDEMKIAMLNAPNPGVLADLVAFAIALKKNDAQEFLETIDVTKRFEKLLLHLKREQEVTEIQKKINEEITQKMHKVQKEYFLKEQLRSIRKELDGGSPTVGLVDQLREKIENTKLSAEAKKIASEELNKLDAMSENSPEYNIIRNYLDWILALPWGIQTKDVLDLKRAKQVLNEDHYGIPKVKDRILEYLAVKKLNPQAKGTILCLVGPPGVGKTSLGKSIAKALDRKFFRFSLGGMRDEAEIKGHRRTYIGAMPGKLLNALKRTNSENPVLMLDEIDKLTSSYHGDPASALLEVLDPEQNQNFIDHYLDIPYDLSNVMFILTANTTSTIPAPLLDRMEIIELNGYTIEEKEKIAEKYIIPKELETHGLKTDQVSFQNGVLNKLMLEYCREPGVRSLQQKIATLCRKAATKIVENPKTKKVLIRSKDLFNYLGPEKFDPDLLRRADTPGVAVGLAWTALGGQILFIEASDVPRQLHNSKTRDNAANNIAAKGSVRVDPTYGHLKLTGQLGEVMSESAAIAYSYIKKKTKHNKNAQKFFEKNDIHLHIPAGAIPKDGPSAGITLATALLSLVTGTNIKNKLAMTGELSLVGKVLPVGGIREKVLAAKRAGIETVILPKKNQKDLKEIPKENLKGMKFIFVNSVEDVFKSALCH